MKLMKKVLALIMALTIVLSMAVSVSADEDTTDITINGAVPGATYNGYKILNLTASLKAQNCHGDIKDHTATCFNFAYTINEKYRTILVDVTRGTTDKEILEYISAMTSNTDAIRTFADDVYEAIKDKKIAHEENITIEAISETAVLQNVSQGYWLIEEVLPAGNAEKDHSLTMLTTMGIRDITVDTKRDNITLIKDTHHNDVSSWEMVGDNKIGDTVHFYTKSQVPDAHGFKEYTYIIHDTMSEGLTFNADSVTVHINAVDGTALEPQYYDVIVDDTICGDCTFHVEIDVKAALADKKVDGDDFLFTRYTATLNENAAVYQNPENPEDPEDREQNLAFVEYSNNPYDETKTTKTPPDVTYEYTFKLGVKKTDSLSNELQGAKFVLSLDGSKKPASFDQNKDGVVDDANDVKHGLIQFIYNSVDKTYVIKPADVDETKLESNETLTYVIEAGNATIKGLDDAVAYYMYEIKAPDGYNALTEPVSVKIFAEYDADGSLKDGYPYVQMGDYKSADMGISIQNNSGTVMPSTGGIGTTLFYVVGGIMVAAALVLLITKKRMAV